MSQEKYYVEAYDPAAVKPSEEVLPRMFSALMSDKETFKTKIGPFAKRSERNAWATSIEPIVREKAPFPASYDVSSMQSTAFGEFTYTEFSAGGMYISTQSKEINARLIDFASKHDSGKLGEEMIQKFIQALSDKYVLKQTPEKYLGVEHVIFLPGHNLLDLADINLVQRLCQEEDDIWVKPHPLTEPNIVNQIAQKVGWNRIIPKDVSGQTIMNNCKTVYTTTASEFCITGAALGKRVYNISRFECEGAGVYQPFCRVITIAQKRQGIEEAKRILGNILACPWSGVVFEFQEDFENRIDMYFAKALELRELYRPLSCGRGDLDKRNKGPMPQQKEVKIPKG